MASTLQRSILEALEEAENYAAWVASLVAPFLGDDPIEIGSGTGTYARIWLDRGLRRLTVSDTDAELVERLRGRFAGDARVSVRQLDLLQAKPAEHTAVVALNVLEHIGDDISALRAAARLVHPGGAVVMFVPAFPFAMSRFDRAIGHYRRYTGDVLRKAFAEAGLRHEHTRYVNAPGLVAWVLGMGLLRLTPRQGMLLRVWDQIAVPAARKLETRWRPPFGQSLLGVARTTA